MKKIISLLLVIINLFSINGLGRYCPYLAVVADVTKVGLDYISLETYDGAPSKTELRKIIDTLTKQDQQHPFVLVPDSAFEVVRDEIENNDANDYSKALTEYVLDNADGLLNTDDFPPMVYELDEEDSILPISRETFNRIVILGFAWQVTGDSRYADRAWLELKNVCEYEDWCTNHFLATAEMALAVATGYDWFYDYLSEKQRDFLAETTYFYAIKPALSKNYLKNWFTWSKNNWNSICYSGIGIACMAFASRYPDEAAEFLHMCYKNMPIAFSNFTPDGVYAEGSGYCQSGMDAIVYFIATSRNCFDSDFGIAEIDGFYEMGYFPVRITTPTGVFNFGDNKNRRCYTPSLHWYASEFDSALLAAYQMQDYPSPYITAVSENTEKSGEGKENALSALWYDRTFNGDKTEFVGEPLSVHLASDVGEDLFLSRSAYLDGNAVFAGIKGGYNYTNHGDLDIGTFVYDALGERWAEELGPGNYDAPNYFVNLPAGGRWKNYSKRAEGQNTLVINPKLTLDDQYALAECCINAFDEESGTCSVDMTNAYRMNGATYVNRDFSLDVESEKLMITDTVNCICNSDIYWFMHTKAAIEISDDGKTAILTKNGKQIKVSCVDDGVFSVMEPKSLKPSYVSNNENIELQKLTVYLNNVKNADIRVTLEPIQE